MPLLGGIRPPIALLLVLLLGVSGLTAVAVGGLHLDDAPQAIRESQQYAAVDAATALRASVNENATDLRRAAARFDAAPAEPAAVLGALGQAYQKWRGTVILQPGSGKLLAARGETVPLAGLDLTALGENAPAPALTSSAGGPRLLTFALVATPAGGRALLVASGGLRLPSITTGKTQSLQVLDDTGAVLDSTGPLLTAEPDKRIVTTARARATRQPAGGEDLVSGSLVGSADQHGARRIVGYAAVAGTGPQDLAAPLGLTMVSSTTVDRQAGSLRHPLLGLAAAGILLLIALLVAGLLVRTLQRPLLGLFLESRRLTRGERLDQPVTGPTRGEAGRITRALEELRLQLRDPARQPPAAPEEGGGRRRRFAPGIALPLALSAVVVLGWSGPLLLLSGDKGAIRVPGQVVSAQRDRTDTTADRVRQALNEGYADLKSIAPGLGDGTEAKPIETVLRAALADHGRYRSLYVLGPTGAVVARAGEAPRHSGAATLGADGVLLLNKSGKEPQIAARVVLGPQAAAAAADPNADPNAEPAAPAVPTAVVVGEFKREFLDGLLTRPGLGRVWLVDERHRILSANEAFSSFGELPEHRAEGVLTAAAKSAEADVVRHDGDPAVLAAAPLGGNGTVGRLGWSVVSAQPVAWLHLDQNKADRRAVLAGMLGLAAAALCLGWLFIAVGIPLRRLAASARALAAGDRRTVLYPVHHDEVGAVARSLELLRQYLEQRGRQAAGRSAARAAGQPADPPGAPAAAGHR
ncbi:HAMP domain-containing protein [Kitasatospora sp. NPDC057015]|uniref:HAMP domain-containing protein n=1 Tax=Kitasatospora sp. NPDC057015 TaxID=3346001 RepID=UPI0036357BB3